MEKGKKACGKSGKAGKGAGNHPAQNSTLSPQAFAQEKRALGHDVRCLRLFLVDRLCTVLYADFTDKTLCAENHIDNPVMTAFGNNPSPDWEAFTAFLRERCIPQERAGLREYLEALGLTAYDPWEIILKTDGRMAEDQQWVEIGDGT